MGLTVVTGSGGLRPAGIYQQSLICKKAAVGSLLFASGSQRADAGTDYLAVAVDLDRLR
ncbi:hypothetical protein XMIN_3136 [Xanthomonas citri pv. mangiferaeindicae LMG 941]|nr:hypothetical protein XAPC_3108 [Xanthomonas citri pv. punicae str. LMG 859]CCG38145.1 hypothetical protein XMIN_3136 [Xanthomonas citri pv. mangiferaeindicae LMG 941]